MKFGKNEAGLEMVQWEIRDLVKSRMHESVYYVGEDAPAITKTNLNKMTKRQLRILYDRRYPLGRGPQLNKDQLVDGLRTLGRREHTDLMLIEYEPSKVGKFLRVPHVTLESETRGNPLIFVVDTSYLKDKGGMTLSNLTEELRNYLSSLKTGVTQ